MVSAVWLHSEITEDDTYNYGIYNYTEATDCRVMSSTRAPSC